MMTTNYNEKNDVDSAHVVGSVNGMGISDPSIGYVVPGLAGRTTGIHESVYLQPGQTGSGALSQATQSGVHESAYMQPGQWSSCKSPYVQPGQWSPCKSAPEIRDEMAPHRNILSACDYPVSAPKFMAADQMRELLEKAGEKTNRSATDIEDVLSRLIARGLKLQSFEVTASGYRVEFK